MSIQNATDIEMEQYEEGSLGEVSPDETANLTGGRPNKSRFYKTAESVTNFVILVTLIVGVIILISVTSATYDKLSKLEPKDTVTTVYHALGLPGYEGYSWKDVTTSTEGSSVNFYMWSGDSHINAWVDGWLTTHVLDEYDIKLVRVPCNDTGDVVEQIFAEIVSGNINEGLVDLVWINGENFYNLKSHNALYGPFATKVPAAENFDFESDAIKYDFGHSTNGYEMPYNSAQVVFIYDTARFPNSSQPQNMDELYNWVVANPGKFTYPSPCADSDCDAYDYTGSVFIRHFLYYFPNTKDYTDMLGDFNQAAYNSHATYALTKLREMEPYLYQKNGATYHPANIDEQDDLFAGGDIWLSLSYAPSHAGAEVASGNWVNSTMSYVPESGTISNTNFVAIAANAKNKLGAVVVADYIAEIWSQFNRRQAEQWGALQCYSPTAPSVTTGGWQIAFDYLVTTPQTPSTESLRAGAMAELSSTYITTFQKDWYKCVLNYSGANVGASPCVIVSSS